MNIKGNIINFKKVEYVEFVRCDEGKEIIFHFTSSNTLKIKINTEKLFVELKDIIEGELCGE